MINILNQVKATDATVVTVTFSGFGDGSHYGNGGGYGDGDGWGQGAYIGCYYRNEGHTSLGDLLNNGYNSGSGSGYGDDCGMGGSGGNGKPLMHGKRSSYVS